MDSISLATRKMKINTNSRVYLTTVRKASIGKTNNKCCLGCGKGDSYIVQMGI